MHQTIDIHVVPVYRVDARLMPEAGVHCQRRATYIDKLAAQAILQAFLDERDTRHAPDH